MAAELNSRVRRYNISAPGVNTDILATNVTPVLDGTWVVTVCLTTGSVFNLITTDGTTSFTNGLNASAALQAGDMYTFSFGVLTALSYNFQVETDSVIRLLVVNEMTAAVGLNSAQGA
ncbi:MAG TPA: hypothetical protein VI643_03885 [Planctomycetota bacterium]|nr:hypothetical protein [Planctomycetota bacterium]